MKLNPDCVRDVLVCLENNIELIADNDCVYCKEIGWRTISQDVQLNKHHLIEDILYSLLQLNQGGYITGTPIRGGEQTNGIIGFTVKDITWKGHELLANLRGEELWKATKSVASQLGTYSLKALATIASAVVQAKVNQYFGGAQSSLL